MPARISNVNSDRPLRTLDPWILVLAACFNFILLASLRASTLVREYRCFYAAGRMALAKLPLYNREVQTAFQRSLSTTTAFSLFSTPHTSCYSSFPSQDSLSQTACWHGDF